MNERTTDDGHSRNSPKMGRRGRIFMCWLAIVSALAHTFCMPFQAAAATYSHHIIFTFSFLLFSPIGNCCVQMNVCVCVAISICAYFLSLGHRRPTIIRNDRLISLYFEVFSFSFSFFFFFLFHHHQKRAHKETDNAHMYEVVWNRI